MDFGLLSICMCASRHEGQRMSCNGVWLLGRGDLAGETAGNLFSIQSNTVLSSRATATSCSDTPSHLVWAQWDHQNTPLGSARTIWHGSGVVESCVRQRDLHKHQSTSSKQWKPASKCSKFVQTCWSVGCSVQFLHLLPVHLEVFSECLLQTCMQKVTDDSKLGIAVDVSSLISLVISAKCVLPSCTVAVSCRKYFPAFWFIYLPICQRSPDPVWINCD